MNLKELFPEVRFRFSVRRQLEVVVAEVCEVGDEITSGDREKLLEETVDVLHATANLLYSAGYNDAEITATIEKVKNKNYKRGYYKWVK